MGVPDVPVRVITHAKIVCSLYKRALRCLESHVSQRNIFRFEAVLLRERFDENRDIKDPFVAQKLIADGEKELFDKQHPQPLKFANSYGGLTHNRIIEPPDWVLDFWHPLEKAQYPEYFARREKRKEEYTKWWEKTYGKQQPSGHH